MTVNTERLSAAIADRYRILRPLGAGGMATVYLAQDLKHDRQVAIKVLKPELAAVLGAERFVVEIRTTAALQHPHILPLFDSGTADGFLFYVMPYIQGETLRARLDRETQLPVDDAVRMTREIADALDYAHRSGVIHRDIKPENILLHDGRPMVVDFGIALAVSAAAGGRMTETGLSLGTPHYMSPEQATADKEISARSDIYSLASVLYEMLTGNPPHVGATAQQIIMKIITDAAAPVTQFRKNVPPHVAAALAQALEKLPADRFATARQFADALANPAFTTVAAAAIGGGRGAGPRGAPRWLFAATATVALAALGAAVWGWREREAALPLLRLPILLPDSLRLPPGMNGDRVALSPDGRRLVFAAGPISEQTSLWSLAIDDPTPRRLDGTEGAVNPVFSPDGAQLAFVTVGGRRAIRVMSASGGPATTVTDSLVDTGGLWWGDDGYLYFDGHLERDGIARVAARGGSPESVTRPTGSGNDLWHAAPVLLPGGRGVLFHTLTNNTTFAVGVADLQAKTHRILFEGSHPRYAPSGHLLFVTAKSELMAVPFDPSTLTTTGQPFMLLTAVGRRPLGRSDVAVAPTGAMAYATGDFAGDERILHRVSRTGASAPVDSGWQVRAATSRFAVSRDGRLAAVAVYSAGSELPSLWLKRFDTGAFTRFADFGRLPSFSPDGSRLLFAQVDQVLEGPVDGSQLPRVRFKVRGLGAAAGYAHDGRSVLYTVTGDLFVRSLEGDTVPRRITNTTAVEGSPSLSPDGRFLLYTSDESGRSEIYVRPYPDVDRARWVLSSNGGLGPRWGPDGREVLFRDEGGFLVRVTVAPTAQGLTVSTPQRLTSLLRDGQAWGLFEVGPDGNIFQWVLPQRRAAAPAALTYVQNLPELIRRAERR